MKNTYTRRGFTLIELLVVVLIIAILAAVAVPQYKRAVVKSHIAEIAARIGTHRKAMDLFYLENGSFNCIVAKGPTVQDNLSINTFTDCQHKAGTGMGYTCPRMYIDANFSCQGIIYLLFCPGDTSKNKAQCTSNATNTVIMSASSYKDRAFSCSGDATYCQFFRQMLNNQP